MLEQGTWLYFYDTTQNIWCPMCTNPYCNTLITHEQEVNRKSKWERSRSNLRENKDGNETVSDKHRERQMSVFLYHVLPALLCSDHLLNLLLYFHNKTLSQCFALGCMTVVAALLHIPTIYNPSCYLLTQRIQRPLRSEAACLTRQWS